MLFWLRIIWTLGGLALLLPWVREAFYRPSVTTPAGTQSWVAGGFQPNGTFTDTTRGELPDNVAGVGSYLGGDEWQGDAATPWIPAPAGRAHMCIAGYPQVAGCSVRVEFRLANGAITQRVCDLPNPGETWKTWDFFVPATTRKLRIVAEDRSSALTGWVAFSQIFVPTSSFAKACFQGAQVLATLALALTLLWLPGLLLARRAGAAHMRAAIVIGAGPLVLALLAILLWLCAGWIRPTYLGSAIAWVWWGGLGTRIWRRTFSVSGDFALHTTLAIAALSALAATAKATYSSGPEGELFHGTIARTLAVGNRSDARIPFSTSQLIQRHLAPASAEAEAYYTGWTFFSRGPLAGLVAAPIVFATGGEPPAAPTDHFPWEPFDRTGFAAYRIAMIALATTVIVALFATLNVFVSSARALLGAALIALCPFVVHELSFTWPKLAATAWLLSAFLFVHQRSRFGGGVALGIGYLFHPMAILWAPWLALWSAARENWRWRASLKHALWFAAGVALLVLPWMAGSLLPTHLETTTRPGQMNFVRYFFEADWQPATLETWLHTRWMNFSNTFLPFWLHFVYEHHSDINSAYTPAGPLVKFAFSWWNTLPLGMGLLTWAGAMIALGCAFRRYRSAVLLLFVGPSLWLVAYWGSAPTGLMRECGHPLLLAAAAIAIVWLARTPHRLSRLATHRAVPWLQLPETFLILWLTTLANPTPPAVALNALDPFWFTVNLAALAAIALLASRARDRMQSPLPLAPP